MGRGGGDSGRGGLGVDPAQHAQQVARGGGRGFKGLRIDIAEAILNDVKTKLCVDPTAMSLIMALTGLTGLIELIGLIGFCC